jgi:hypothetical protein
VLSDMIAQVAGIRLIRKHGLLIIALNA